MSQVGALLADRYRLERRLGSGGMGVVWLATDERLRRPVAVKQLIVQSGLDPARAAEAQQRAMREGRIAARLHHPNVVAVHDVTEHDGLPVLVMEHLPSRSLDDVLAEQGAQAVQTAAVIGAHAAAALAAAHEAGIIHRDVKPANVLLGDDGSVKITDFGVSLAAGDVSVTQTGMLNGTPAFLAPEIAQGHPPAPASDVFSLGATLYAALEGRPPFGAQTENSLAVLHEVAAGHVPPPQRAGALGPLLAQLMHLDPAARPAPQRAGEILRALADGQPIAATEYISADASTQPLSLVTDAATAPRPARSTGTRVAERPVGGAAATSLGAAARRHRKALAVLGATLAALVLVALLIPQREPPTPPTTPLAAPADLERVASDYYALLPEHPGNAWTRLGPGLQAPGRSGYEQYWNSVAAVEVIDPPHAVGRNVLIGVELQMADGSKVREFHQLGVTAHTGAPLIEADTVVRTETTAPPPPPPAPVVIERPAPQKKDEGKDSGENGKKKEKEQD